VTYPGLPSTLGAVLLGPHSIRVRVQVLTLEMKPTGQDITARILAGQVNVDSKAAVTRSLTATFRDPDRQLDFDSNSPADGALYADRMLRVWYGVRRPGGEWIDVPIFTGPVVAFARDGALVEVECQGKEALALGASWRTKTYKKHMRKTEVIESVMRNEGERHFDFEGFKGDLPGDRSLTPQKSSWEFAQKIAQSMGGAQLFYDGWGRLRLRKEPKRTAWTFRDGDGEALKTQPRISFSTAEVANAVRVVGKKPKGHTRKVKATAVAPANHPLSPRRLGRNGEGRYLAEFVEDSSIGSEAEARRVAKSKLSKRLAQVVTVEADTFVVPHLEEGDPIRFSTSDFGIGTTAERFTIPLVHSEPMSVGYNRRALRLGKKNPRVTSRGPGPLTKAARRERRQERRQDERRGGGRG
jgi:hypothetical protein